MCTILLTIYKQNMIDFLKNIDKEELYELAHNITHKHLGNRFDSCSIINAKSGNCSENCKWCAQSVHSCTKINIYPLISKEKALAEAIHNSNQGIQRFSLVTSGKRVSKQEVEAICKIVEELKAKSNVIPCVSLGLIDEEDLRKLYLAGVKRYHCNIETAPSHFKNLCTSHTIEEKMATINAARRVGMSVCSGGIIGMGETMEQRIEMAQFLSDNKILSIPINVLHPIKGTPLENSIALSEDEILTTIAIFRILNPNAFLRFAGGRALLSKEIQKKALYIGINAAIMGDMLTTLGSGAQEDIELFESAGYDFFNKNEGSPKCIETNLNNNTEVEQHIWHPYSGQLIHPPTYFVESANGATITIKDYTVNKDGQNKTLIDGMSSWWAAIHGYNNPKLNAAAENQLGKMSHVMFGGLTHHPAQELSRLILNILPKSEKASLSEIFYSDSGSVAVEVAMKMAVQYQVTRGNSKKTKFATALKGYHGDTWNAMSVCDPQTGMHSIFGPNLPISFFAPAPTEDNISEVETIFEQHSTEIAAFIIEPIVQGAGGMRFYCPSYLIKLRELCNKYNILLIFDEIATGFGRTGKLFAMDHTARYTKDKSSILPDILTIGKALTGGYMSLAATICRAEIAYSISMNNPNAFMHGPTFMANPLACSIACASIKELLSYDWKSKVEDIEQILKTNLSKLNSNDKVRQVRVLGAIGVIEMKENVDLNTIQAMLVNEGIWLRPFGKLIYTMPPYIISKEELEYLCKAIVKVVESL